MVGVFIGHVKWNFDKPGKISKDEKASAAQMVFGTLTLVIAMWETSWGSSGKCSSQDLNPNQYMLTRQLISPTNPSAPGYSVFSSFAAIQQGILIIGKIC